MTKKEAMDCFLKRYNPDKTVEVALSKAISAAVQHNKLYNTQDINRRKDIRGFWAERLADLADKQRTGKLTSQNYLNEVLRLKEVMNTQFNDIDFRISHSQKSISVYFKHLWCMGEISLPPQCPVDRIILTKISAPLNDRSWGYVDTIEEHNRKYEMIKVFARSQGFDNESEWELVAF